MAGLLGYQPSPITQRLTGLLSVDPAGFPIDLKRPIVADAGESKTEFTITEQLSDGMFYNIPTVWDGRALDPQADRDKIISRAVAELSRGVKLPAFKSLQEATAAAQQRSEYIGWLRGHELDRQGR